MQETPNFQSYLTRFNQFALSALIDGAQPVAEPQRSVIEDAYNKLSLYLTDNQYRDKLTTVSRNNIEGQINSILAQFDQITSLLQTNPPSLTSSLESISNNIQSYLEELNLRFYNPYQTYLLQNQGNVGAIVNEITNFRKEAEKSEAETKKVLDKAKLTVGIGASISLADHYQIIANGRTAVENDEYRRDKRVIINNPKIMSLGIIFVSLLLIFHVKQAAGVYSSFNGSGFNTVYKVVCFAILTLGLISYPAIRYVRKHKIGGHDRSAMIWLMASVLSVIITAIFALFLVHQLNGKTDLNQIIPKLVSLLAPAYFVRFCVQNYRANMHLYVLNNHRAIVSRVAPGFSELIDATNNPALQREQLGYRANIIDKGASVVFDPGETGYITRKEGAGSSDSLFDGTFLDNKFLK